MHWFRFVDLCRCQPTTTYWGAVGNNGIYYLWNIQGFYSLILRLRELRELEVHSSFSARAAGVLFQAFGGLVRLVRIQDASCGIWLLDLRVWVSPKPFLARIAWGLGGGYVVLQRVIPEAYQIRCM